MLTSTGEYALRAMIHIAEHKPDEFVLAHGIGKDLQIPERYLSKILGILTRKDLLIARRGRGGGFRLKHSPDNITIFQILNAVDRTEHFERCILGYQTCSDQTACAMHSAWSMFKDRILELLQNVSIGDIVDGSLSQETAFNILKMPSAKKIECCTDRTVLPRSDAGGMD